MVAVLLMNCVVQGQTKKEKKDQTKIAEKVKAAMAEQEVRMAAYEKKRIAAVGVYLEGKSISAEIVKGLREGFLVRGMTAEEFSLACGSPPGKVNVTEDSSGRREQWFYGTSFYLFFQNGKVDGWQDNTGHPETRIDKMKLDSAKAGAIGTR